MTATIKPAERRPATSRGLRFSSLESLGFSDDRSVWSDAPAIATTEPEIISTTRRGRHEAPEVEPETMADWQPEDFGSRLTGSNVRWNLIVVLVTLVGALAVFGYWLYERPLARNEASLIEVDTRALDLMQSLPTLEKLNNELLGSDLALSPTSLSAVESTARALFEASGDVDSSQTDLRRASSDAAGSALDAVRLVNEASAYRAAVMPTLVTPSLQTDPGLIELDEAARMFGDWQLTFNSVRTALPDNTLSDVTLQLDLLSGDLNSILTGYVDALREDDRQAANAVVTDLGLRLARINDELVSAIGDIQTRVSIRIEETRLALQPILRD